MTGYLNEAIYSNRNDDGLLAQSQNCNKKQNFVCTLPEECHADVCSSHCTPKTINHCDPPSAKKVIFKLYYDFQAVR
jgi:hypothetical protein